MSGSLDLIVQNRALTPTAPSAGQTVTFTADVANNGSVAAGHTSSTRLYIDGAPVPPDPTTGDLAPGAAETETWNWTATEGDHTYQICADDDGAGGVITESDETNNCTAQVPFTVSPPPSEAPDLAVQDHGLAPAAPTTGQTVSFTAQVVNNGSAPAGGSSSTRLYIDGAPVPPDPTTGDLAPGAAETETWSWSATEGDHTYQICADDDGAGGVITESDETNNCTAQVPFSVTASTGSVTVAATGAQIPTLDIPASGEYVGGAFTFVRDNGSAAIKQITFTETGTVDANTSLSDLSVYYEAAADCNYDGTEQLFGSAASFDVSEKAAVSGSMVVGTSQVCVYAVLTVGAAASDGETLEIEISDPSTEVMVDAGSLTPSTPVAIAGTTILNKSRATVTIAFIGDQGWESPGESSGPRAVLQLIKDDGADAVMHQGDFDYGNDPAAWEQQIDDVLGADFPYFVSIGNHDVDAWSGSGGYQARMEQRLQRLGLSWQGELGVQGTVEFQGIFLVFGAPGIFDSDNTDYAAFFADRLSTDNSTWSICSWHKNQQKMQVGGKGDETGWGVYERCREGGAIIATAHEHSYSRTHLLSNMENQVIASTSDTLTLTSGESFVFVSGLGGRSIRGQSRSGDWWASIYTADQGANYGALFGVFYVDGRDDLAYFYFKDIDGVIADEFWVVSRVD
ncbi:MAG: metallophosphoesterase [Gemmatimonadota bacterium]|nr:MAG: metallophosphoesterase [Gemmatimonadota bacterium]